MKKKICIVLRYPPSTAMGTDPCFVDVIKFLKKKKVDVHIFSYKETNPKYIDKDIIYHNPLSLTFNRKNNFDKLTKSFLFLFIAPIFVSYLHRKYKFDAVYFDDSLPLYWYLTRLSTKAKLYFRYGDIWCLFLQEEDSKIIKLTAKVYYFFERKLFWKSMDRVMAMSKAIKEHMIRVGGVKRERVRVIKESIDLDVYAKRKVDRKKVKEKLGLKDEKVIIFHGMFGRFKRIETLLYAIPKILEKHQNIKLILVGGGPSLNELKGISQKLNIKKHVIFTGWVPEEELLDYIGISDIAVGIRGKNFANNFIVTTSMLQDLALGKAVLAPDLITMSSVVRDNISGLVYKTQDHEDLAKKINFLLDNPNEIKRLSEHSRDHIKDYDTKIVASTIVDFLLE